MEDCAIIVVNAARGCDADVARPVGQAFLAELSCNFACGARARNACKVRDDADAKTRYENKKGGNDSVDYF